MKRIFRTHLFSDNHMPALIAAQQMSFQLYFHQNVCWGWERGKWRESCFCRFPGMVTRLLRHRYERCICYSAPRYVRFHPIVLGGKLFTRNIGILRFLPNFGRTLDFGSFLSWEEQFLVKRSPGLSFPEILCLCRI